MPKHHKQKDQKPKDKPGQGMTKKSKFGESKEEAKERARKQIQEFNKSKIEKEGIKAKPKKVANIKSTREGKKPVFRMDKQAYALKPLPPVEKNPGIHELPTKVRNKMGYQMDSSHSFKGKVANNMKTMYMGSVYSMSHLKKGDIVPVDGSMQQLEGFDTEDVVKEVFTEKTVPGFSGSPDFKTAFANARKQGLDVFEFGGKKYTTELSTDPNFGKDKVITEKTTEKSQVKTPKFSEIKQEFDPATNFERRQQSRGATFQERQLKRDRIKLARNKAKMEGLKGKKKREAIRKAKLAAKDQQRKSLIKRRGDIREQTMMQEQQGIIGNSSIDSKGNIRKITRNFTPIVVDDETGITQKGQMTKAQEEALKKGMSAVGSSFMMNLPPKAMMYFNRKNNKK